MTRNSRIRSLNLAALLSTAIGLTACNISVRGNEALLGSVDTVALQTADTDPLGRSAHVSPWLDRIVAVDDMQRNVKVFSIDGSLLMTLGRAGDGPGEFRRPLYAAEMPDGRLVVVDQALSRATTFSPTGIVDTTWRIDIGVIGGLAITDAGDIVISGLVHDDLGVHTSLLQFSGTGELRREVFRSLVESRLVGYGVPGVAIAGQDAIIVEPTANRAQIINLQSGTTRPIVLQLPPELWTPWRWEERPADPEAGLAWVREQAWLQTPIPRNGNTWIVPVSRFPQGDSEHGYALIAADGRVLRVSHPSTRWIAAAIGGNAYDIDVAEDGSSVMMISPLRW